MTISTIKALGIGAAAFAMATSAYAQEAPTVANLDHCVSKQEIITRLNNEGQYILVTADRRMALEGTGGVVALKNVFTANKNFSYGYQLMESTSGEMCKADTYQNPKLLEARNQNIDGRTELPTTTQQNSLRNAVLAGSRSGDNPMLQYTTTFTNSGAPAKVTVTGKVGETGGYLLARADGIVVSSVPFVNPKYSPTAEATLKSGTQLASLRP